MSKNKTKHDFLKGGPYISKEIKYPGSFIRIDEPHSQVQHIVILANRFLPSIDFPKGSDVIAEYIKNNPHRFPSKSSLRDDSWDDNHRD